MIYFIFGFQLILLVILLYGLYKVIEYKNDNYIAKKFMKVKRKFGKKTFYQWLELDCIVPTDFYKKNGLVKDNIKVSVFHSNNKHDGLFPVNKLSEYEIYEFLNDNKLIAFYHKAKDKIT
jgi:hypothetical protein